jgi:hypothetical protein
MRRHAVIMSLAAATVMAITPVAANAATTPAAVRCMPTRPDGGVVQVTTADDTGHVCLLRGQRLSVTLAVDPAVFPNPANWWTPITASSDVLTPLPNTVLPARGTTLARFRANRRGNTTVSSTWSPCPAVTPYRCAAPTRLWRIAVQVLGRRV